MTLRHIKFTKLVRSDATFSPAYVSIDSNGLIKNISQTPPDLDLDIEGSASNSMEMCRSTEEPPQALPGNSAKAPIENCHAIAIPGFQNSHSHAFQYAMAGSAEALIPEQKKDDFWGWRETMYRLALRLTPDDIEVIATMLYSQMLAYGYTSVTEFHYLHHSPNGETYQNLSEIGERLISAASKTGINICLVPVYYRTGDFGCPASERQKRFISNSPEEYFNLLAATAKSCGSYAGAKMGAGFHSLRAAPMSDIQLVMQGLKSSSITYANENSLQNLPIHIHIAEQQKEIKSCLDHTGSRSVDYLYDNIEVDKYFNLVHATHISKSECIRIARSNANVVLCPTTEGNLGDGYFPLADYLGYGGRFSIGSDSHVSLSLLEELRLLEYGQRMNKQQRNIHCNPTALETGDALFWPSISNGSLASGMSYASPFPTRNTPEGLTHSTASALTVGTHLDVVLIDPDHHAFSGFDDTKFLSTLIFAANSKALIGVMSRGRKLVSHGTHRGEENYSRIYSKTLRKYFT